MRRVTLVLGMALMTPTVGAAAQDINPAHADYFRAVASFFDLPTSEVVILGDWDIPAEEIPVALFIASRAGVSAEAIGALRGAGQSWSELAGRYRVTASILHVPIRDGASAGRLSGVYDRYRQTPVSDWPSIALTDGDIIALVNVRVISQSVGASTEEVFRRTESTSSFIELYAQLRR
jgi:hypothetical protein